MEALTWRLELVNENIVEDKSFADDLTIKQGIVSSRAKLILRGAEIKPLFSDLCFGTFLPHYPPSEFPLPGDAKKNPPI